MTTTTAYPNRFTNHGHPLIFYLCPDIELKSAGIRRLYRHVQILNQNGFDAGILHFQEGFRRSDMPEVPLSWLDRHHFSDRDILVIPEGCTHVMEALKDHPGRRFAIALNWDYVFKDLAVGTDWRRFRIERVLTTSSIMAGMIAWSMDLPTHVLHSSIDRRYYADTSSKRPLLVYIARKAPHVEALKRMIRARDPALSTRIQWLGLHGLSEPEYAAHILEASIFLNLSPAEGFPTSCLEAMAAGTLVAGYDSVGGRDLLVGHGPQQNCILAPNADYVALAYALEPALKSLVEDRWDGWSPVRDNARTTVEGLTPENEASSLVEFWRSACTSDTANQRGNGGMSTP